GGEFTQVTGDGLPRGVIARNIAWLHCEASSQRRPTDETFNAVLVETAHAGKVVASGAAQAKMPDFRVHGAVHGAPADHEAAAHTGSKGDVAEAVTSDRRTSAVFGQCCRVDIGVDQPRASEAIRQCFR